ncbi:MAG: hypothetical protein RRZ84_01245 [Romboutsia sp.]
MKKLVKINKSQNNVKYTFIVLSMVVALLNHWISTGFLSTVPIIIIVPFVLRVLFKESKLIIITGICSHIIMALVNGDIALGIVSAPLLIMGIGVGILLGKLVKSIMEEI